jgi:hypothetical protein
MGLREDAHLQGVNSVCTILGNAGAAGMGFDRGGTAVIGSLFASSHHQYAHWLVRCNMGLGPIKWLLQLNSGGFRRGRSVRDMAMATTHGEPEGCVVCEAGVECGVSPNDEKGSVESDSLSSRHTIFDFRHHRTL